MIDFFSNNIEIFIGAITTLVSFFAGRKIQKVDIENKEIEGLKSIIEIQRETIERMDLRIIQLENKVYSNIETINNITKN